MCTKKNEQHLAIEIVKYIQLVFCNRYGLCKKLIAASFSSSVSSRTSFTCQLFSFYFLQSVAFQIICDGD